MEGTEYAAEMYDAQYCRTQDLLMHSNARLKKKKKNTKVSQVTSQNKLLTVPGDKQVNDSPIYIFSTLIDFHSVIMSGPVLCFHCVRRG